MHKFIIKAITVLFVIIASTSALAAEFIASIIDKNVSVGQSFVLNLSLRDAQAKSMPELSALRSDFTIYSQQQYSTFSSVNGNISSESGWDITLIPNKDGDITIPSIMIKTDQGTLQSAPIQLIVAKNNSSSPLGGASQNQNSNKQAKNSNVGISMIATTNKVNPYVKEPIIYTLKIISYKNLMNLTLEDIKASDAIIDKIGQPKQYEQSFGGARALVIELKYHITPLVPGKITIMPAVIRGEMQSIAQRQVFGHGFGMMHNPFFDPIGSLEPFEVRGDKLTLNAKEAPIQDPNWLPLTNLTLSEEWDGINAVKVGDTIVRKVKLSGVGTFSNQLTSVKNFVEIPGVKLYADTPIFTDNPTKNNDEIVGTREETFTIIPTVEGKITFPAIKIGWWNLQAKRLETATLPAKTINVLPAASKGASDTSLDFSAGIPKAIDEQKQSTQTNAIGKVYYLIIGLLTLIVILLFAVIVALIGRKKKNLPQEKVKNQQQPSVDNSKIHSIDDLRMQINEHARNYWGIDENTTISALGTELEHKQYIYSLELLNVLSEKMNIALYAGMPMDLAELIELWQQFKLSVVKKKTIKYANKVQQQELNPT